MLVEYQACFSAVECYCFILPWYPQYRYSCGITAMSATSFPHSTLTFLSTCSFWCESSESFNHDCWYSSESCPDITLLAPFSPIYFINLIIYPQFEVIIQFFMGTLDASDRYCDNLRVIAFKYCASFTGFWFDFVTSLPWSFNDLYSYEVIF